MQGGQDVSGDMAVRTEGFGGMEGNSKGSAGMAGWTGGFGATAISIGDPNGTVIRTRGPARLYRVSRRSWRVR